MPVFSHTNADASSFLGMKPWYEGLTYKDDKDNDKEKVVCVVDKADDRNGDGLDDTTNCRGLSSFVWTAAANVASDLAIVAAIGAIGFVLYGGYLYMFSGGEATKVYNGKKTIINALIGLAITMVANIVFVAIRAVLLHSDNFSPVEVEGKYGYTAHLVELTDPGLVVTDLIAWAVGFAGVVCAIFLVYGGVGYMTSSGDSNKIKKAKDAITYALIGLAIVGLAEVITAVAANAIRDSINKAEPATSANITLIGKETNEKIN